jgi:hypothetical protein
MPEAKFLDLLEIKGKKEEEFLFKRKYFLVC